MDAPDAVKETDMLLQMLADGGDTIIVGLEFTTTVTWFDAADIPELEHVTTAL